MNRRSHLAVVALVVALLAGALGIPPAVAQDKLESGGESMERVIIGFHPGAKLDVVQQAERAGGQIHYEFDELNAVAMTLPGEAVSRLRADPRVTSIEPDHPRFATDQTIPYGIDSVEARDVWDRDRDGIVDPGAPTGAGRMICIIDSGVNTSHEDLVSASFAGGYPTDWNTDTCGHGTHVAGTVAAVNNTTGIVGVSPGEVSLYILKVYGDNCSWTYSSTLVDAAYRCRDAGANVISMSLAGSYYSSYENSAFQSIYDDYGILIVAAAGNGGSTAYGYPASYDSVVSVGAVDANNVLANFSQRNDKVELVAPGVSVYSTSASGGYQYKSGTSMSTPHVSAAAAIVWSTNPTKTNGQVRAAMQNSAMDLGAGGRDNSYGFGLMQTECACQALNADPTSVRLVRFEAFGDESSITIEWETAMEIDNLGFNLYRAQSISGARVQLNSSIIPSKVPGSPIGAVYEFLDESVEAGGTYYYWLEAIDFYGSSEEYGPVVARVLYMKLVPSSRSKPGRTGRPGH